MNESNKDALMTALGSVIQERRRSLRLSQEELAAKAGLHRTYISEIERRSRNLTVKILIQIAIALELTPSGLMLAAENLVSGKGSDPKPQPTAPAGQSEVHQL